MFMKMRFGIEFFYTKLNHEKRMSCVHDLWETYCFCSVCLSVHPSVRTIVHPSAVTLCFHSSSYNPLDRDFKFHGLIGLQEEINPII